MIVVVSVITGYNSFVEGTEANKDLQSGGCEKRMHGIFKTLLHIDVSICLITLLYSADHFVSEPPSVEFQDVCRH